MEKMGQRGYLLWPWLPSRSTSLIPSLKHNHATSMPPGVCQWLPQQTGLQNLAPASEKLHHPVVNLTVLGGGWKKNGNLAERQPETQHQSFLDPRTRTLFPSCKEFAQPYAKAQPVVLYTPTFTSVLPSNAPASPSQPDCGPLSACGFSVPWSNIYLCDPAPTQQNRICDTNPHQTQSCMALSEFFLSDCFLQIQLEIKPFPLRGWVPCLTSCNSPENKHRNYAAIGNHHFMRWTPLPAFFHRVTCVTVGLGYV